MPQFNAIQWNGGQFNVNTISKSIFDGMTLADASDLDGIEIVKTEAVSMALNLIKTFNNNPFLEDIIASGATLEKEVFLTKLETITGVDIKIIEFLKALADTVSMADIRTMFINVRKLDTLFLQEFFNAQLTNKGLSDTVRMAIWLQVKRKISQNQFGDE